MAKGTESTKLYEPVTGALSMPTLGRRYCSVGRVVVMSLGLLLTGMVVGAGIALALASSVVLVTDGARGFDAWEPFVLVAGAGALVGGVLGPLLAWTMLRRVPLGRAVLHCAVGGACGSALAMLGGEMTVLVLAITGPLGAWIAARRLRKQYAIP